MQEIAIPPRKHVNNLRIHPHRPLLRGRVYQYVELSSLEAGHHFQQMAVRIVSPYYLRSEEPRRVALPLLACNLRAGPELSRPRRIRLASELRQRPYRHLIGGAGLPSDHFATGIINTVKRSKSSGAPITGESSLGTASEFAPQTDGSVADDIIIT